MFILFVYLVSMNFLMIRTHDNLVNVEIKDGGQRKTCDVLSEVTLVEDSNFTLVVKSCFFIKKSYWYQPHKHHKNRKQNLQELDDSKLSITYERNMSSENKQTNNVIFTYSHTQKVRKHSGGTWNFTFELIRKYDPWTFDNQNLYGVENWWCNTSVQIVPTSARHPNHATSGQYLIQSPPNGTSNPVGGRDLLIILASVFGILLFVQSSFIIYGKVCRKSNRNNDEDPISPKSPKTKRGAKPTRNIADRPPLPLPPDEVVKEEAMPPPMSPVSKRHHLFSQATAPPMPVENSYNSHPVGPVIPKQSYINKGLDASDGGAKSSAFARRKEVPLVPKKSYRNKGLDHSDEDIRSPGFPRSHNMEGPLVPKQSHRNKSLENSDEDLRSPGFPRRQKGPLVPKESYTNKSLDSDEEPMSPAFARRQIQAQLAQLAPKAITASKSFKVPKPLPRSPPTPPPENAPAFHPAHRKEPAPPLHPKKLPIFAPTAPCRQPDFTDPRMSDADWQYETLQPASKYLNNYSDTPYNNI